MNKLRNFLTRVLLPVSLVAAAAGPALAEKAPVTVDIKRLSLETAQRLAEAALHKCRAEGVQVAVTVVDRGGNPQVVLRDTLAMDLTLAISRQKAYTAMSFNSPTSALSKRFTEPFSVGKLNGLVFSAGGVPITAAGTILGGVGVSGAPSGETDEKCAQAGLEAVMNDLEMAGF